MVNAAYNTSAFWEWALANHDVWQGFFMDAKRVTNPVILNTAIIQTQGDVFDSNWACYPDMYAVLGFIQYVYVPAAFYLLLHPQNSQIYIPVGSAQAYIDEHIDLRTLQGRRMAYTLQSLAGLWALDSQALSDALPRFCSEFSAAWTAPELALHIRSFSSTYAVNQFLRTILWADDVFYEDLGTTPGQFRQSCSRFYQEPTSRDFFVRFLNHGIGCVV